MPIHAPILMEIDRKTWLIHDFGRSAVYALCGEERGLLIDAGCGDFDLPGLADRLFDGHPYDVALTHAHPCHAGGAGLFPVVFRSEREGALPQCGQATAAVSPDFAPAPFLPHEYKTASMPLHTGQRFDLGGRRVTCVWTPGHTAGSFSFVDSLSHIAFVGDACGRALRLNRPVSDALTGLLRLARLCPDIDRLYGGHPDYTDSRALPAALLAAAADACRAALSPDAAHYACEGGVCCGGVTLRYGALWADFESHSPYPVGL